MSAEKSDMEQTSEGKTRDGSVVEAERPRLVLEPRGRADTDPMFPPPIESGPTHRGTNDTQPMYVVRPTPSLSAIEADTSPDPMPPPGAEAQREAQDFLQKFARPLRPPTSPRTAQGASSDGRKFVAHYTETRPVPRTRSNEPAPGVHVLDRLAQLARAPIVNPPPDTYGPLQDGLTAPSRRRRYATWRTAGAAALGVLLLVAFIVWRVPGEPAAATNLPATSSATASTSAMTAPPPSSAATAALPPVTSSAVVAPTVVADAPGPSSTRLPPSPPARSAAVRSTTHPPTPQVRGSQLLFEDP